MIFTIDTYSLNGSELSRSFWNRTNISFTGLSADEFTNLSSIPAVGARAVQKQFADTNPETAFLDFKNELTLSLSDYDSSIFAAQIFTTFNVFVGDSFSIGVAYGESGYTDEFTFLRMDVLSTSPYRALGAIYKFNQVQGTYDKITPSHLIPAQTVYCQYSAGQIKFGYYNNKTPDMNTAPTEAELVQIFKVKAPNYKSSINYLIRFDKASTGSEYGASQFALYGLTYKFLQPTYNWHYNRVYGNYVTAPLSEKINGEYVKYDLSYRSLNDPHGITRHFSKLRIINTSSDVLITINDYVYRQKAGDIRPIDIDISDNVIVNLLGGKATLIISEN